MENEIQKPNINEVIKIEQLPKILYQLEEVGKYISEELKDIETLDCSEATKQLVKNKRTEINNTLAEFENARKNIKNTILNDYEIFEKKYNVEVKTKLLEASKCLSDKINVIEEEQKNRKKENLIEFFEQYKEYYHLEDIISFEDLKLNITLSASETSLKNQIKDFLEKVNEDLIAISSEENKEEILYEYKRNDFNYTKAVNIVNARHKELEDLKKKSEKIDNLKEEETRVIENVNTLCSAPVEIQEEPEEIIEVSFTIKTTKTKILQLKQWLKDNEVDYE